jgi:hypothetical protein
MNSTLTAEMPREVVFASTTTRKGELHFKADTISSTTDTTFYIYWNGTALDYVDSDTYGTHNVWSNDFILVLHGNELIDSTRYARSFTPFGGIATTSTGKISQAFLLDGIDDYAVHDLANISLDEHTITVWVNADTASDQESVFASADGVTTDSYQLDYNMTEQLQFSHEDKDIDVGGGTASWDHFAVITDVVGSGFENGIQVDSVPFGHPVSYELFKLGVNRATSAFFDGRIDELRIASTSRSAAWITAEYTNQSTTTDFYTVSDARLSATAHPAGTLTNTFSFQNKTDEPLYSFTLTPSTESITITDLVVSGTGISGVDTSELTDFRLYQDNNTDNAVDGGDTQVGGAGIFTINGSLGAITFSDDFTVSTTTSFLMTADLTSIDQGDTITFRLLSSGLTGTGTTSGLTAVLTQVPPHVQHSRFTQGGGSSARLGGDPAPSDGVVEGGDESGGGALGGPAPDGENISSDPTFFRPSLTGGTHNEWTNPSSAFDSDGVYATAATSGLRQTYRGFGFSIPTNNEITGLALKLDASGSTAAGTIDVALSWDGGFSFTTMKATPTLSGSDVVYLLGGNGDTWGRTWAPTEFTDSLFRVRVTANPGSNTTRLDALEVRVYHQTPTPPSGGGGGGGRL